MNRAERRAAGRRGPQPARTHDLGTYWNGQPTPARRVRVVVGPPPPDMPLHWLHDSGLIGATVNAVEVTYPAWDGPMYLYDGDGSGWFKVTEGHGSPRWGHKNIPVERIVAEVVTPSRTDRQPRDSATQAKGGQGLGDRDA